MKKAIIFESNVYRCEMKAKELGYKPSECVFIPETFSHDRQRKKIRGYWKDVLVDKTIKIYGISEKRFMNLYKGDRKMSIQELSDEMRKERARCSTHCGTWNREDRDCEIYGNQHCPPSKCRYFLATELERGNKEIEK